MIRKLNQKDIPYVLAIIEETKRIFRESGIDQWQNGYPNEESLYSDLKEECGYVFVEENKAIGYAAFIEGEEPSYQNIEGQWLSEGPYLTIHRISVDPKERRKGLGKILMTYAEEKAQKDGMKSLRVDTHADNLGMRKLIDVCGFEYCGIVYVHGNEKRNAYEKALHLQ